MGGAGHFRLGRLAARAGACVSVARLLCADGGGRTLERYAPLMHRRSRVQPSCRNAASNQSGVGAHTACLGGAGHFRLGRLAARAGACVSVARLLCADGGGRTLEHYAPPMHRRSRVPPSCRNAASNQSHAWVHTPPVCGAGHFRLGRLAARVRTLTYLLPACCVRTGECSLSSITNPNPLNPNL